MPPDDLIPDPLAGHDIRCPDCVEIGCFCPRGYYALEITCACGWLGVLVAPKCARARPRCARCGSDLGKILRNAD